MGHRQILVPLIVAMLLVPLAAKAVRLIDPANKHNLSKDSTNEVRATAASGQTRICVFCHTPHSASPQSTLWNRKDPGDTGSFPLYSSGSLQITSIPEAQYDNADSAAYPNGASRMCLSCHDGSTAFGFGIGDVYKGTAIAMTYNSLSDLPPRDGLPTPLLDKSIVDLSVAHPISFVYDDGANAVLTAINGAKGAGQYALPSNPEIPLDGQGRMQCTTCHDPHDDTRGEAHGLPFWRNNLAALPYDDTCSHCHPGGDWGGADPHALP